MRIVPRRLGQSWRILRTEGRAAFARRTVAALGRKIGADLPPLLVLPEDVADSTTLRLPPPPAPLPPRTPLRIGWVISPPSEGSGGHTTLFRMVEALESAGHTCTLYVYDRFGGRIADYDRVVRSWWPQIRAQVKDARGTIAPADAYVATSWASAHVLARRAKNPAHRFYLAQDFEPFFYPRGTDYALAEDSYRFGFEHITIGRMVANVLHERIGVASTVAEFGCDTSVYRLLNPQRRNSVIVYAKPDTPRRGYNLGVLALERFHRRYPDVAVHTFGAIPQPLSFPTVDHKHLPPAELNELYNTCAAGLALSFTNISLIAEELLASGVVPVVNDSPYTRADLDNPNVAWVHPAPDAIADALGAAVDGKFAMPSEITASVAGGSWKTAQQVVVSVIERRCWGSD